MNPIQGQILAGRYRIERPLARGGMGSVWIARHLQLDVDVAVKLLIPSYAESDQARVRFEREAKASALLKSPHVVQIYDYGVDGDTPFIVMELLEGEDLDKRLKRERRLSLAATARVVVPVCKALRRAHEAGLVHRDLKPANIFIARHGDDEIVKILDFGIAKSVGPVLVGQATATNSLVGSPQFMSPEQVRDSKAVDHRTDLWALGVIVFRCLTGQLPFQGQELGAVLVAICSDPVPVASQVAPDLGPEVDQFLARALARSPDQRFQSAQELAEALIRIAGPEAERLEAALARSTGSGQRPAQPSIPSAATPPPQSAAAPSAAVSVTLTPTGGGATAGGPRRGRIALAAGAGVLALGAVALAFSLRSSTRAGAEPLAASAARPAPSASAQSAPPPASAAPSASAPEPSAAPAHPAAPTSSGAHAAPARTAHDGERPSIPGPAGPRPSPKPSPASGYDPRTEM